MLRYLSILLAVGSFSASPALRAATKPHAAPASANATRTNEDLKRLSGIPGLISVVGQTTKEDRPNVSSLTPPTEARDPRWYAAQADSLNARLEAAQADLHNFIQALEDARELKITRGGINLAGDVIGITPEATAEILQNRVRETQSELDGLEDLARHNDIDPGVLRDQLQGVPAQTAMLKHLHSFDLP